MDNKIVEIKFKKDGTVNVDQIGFSGSSCSGSIDDILNKLGKERDTKRKSEYWAEEKVRLQEFE